MKYNYPSTWTDTYEIHSFALDSNNRLSILALINFIIGSAGNHVQGGDWNYDFLKGQNLYWVLSRMRLQVFKYPLVNEKIQVETWIRKTDVLFSYRDFQITDNNNNIIALAGVSWALLDADTRKPKRLESMRDTFPHLPERAAFNADLIKLHSPQNFIQSDIYKIRYSDIDPNLHANSTKYIEWVINVLPVEILQTKRIQFIEANYLNETFIHDEVQILTEITSPDEFLNSIVRVADHKELCRIKINFE